MLSLDSTAMKLSKRINIFELKNIKDSVMQSATKLTRTKKQLKCFCLNVFSYLY